MKYASQIRALPGKLRSGKTLKIAAAIAVTLLVFAAGWLTGSGRIRLLNRDYATQSKNLPENLDLSSVEDVYDRIRLNYDGQLDLSKVLGGLKSGLAKSTGDPYTEYFNAKDAQEFRGELNGSFEGIGAELGKDKDDNIIVVSPIKGYPAEKAGLKPKDIIAEVDGKSTADMTISDAIDLIRGPKGTTVKLTLVSDQKRVDVAIVREQITIPSVTYKVENGIGMLSISRFGPDTTDLSQAAAAEFAAAKVKGIILDLRGDPGGYLDAAVDVSSLWLDNQTVLTERRGGQIIKTHTSHDHAPLKGIPTVVLIDGGSASASEITAGALHDNKAATLVGDKSFGKGSVQEPISLPNNALLKVTIARWYTPAGKNIDKEGIQPDKKVQLTDDDAKAGRDPQLDAAKALLPR